MPHAGALNTSFQSTRSCERDFTTLAWTIVLSRFNPRARVSATSTASTASTAGNTFQSTRSCERDPPAQQQSLTMVFQSTRSCERDLLQGGTVG